MSPAGYDEIAAEYAEWVQVALLQLDRILRVVADCLLTLAGAVGGLDVCDLCCGEGHLARRIAAQGGRTTGIDISLGLLALARERSADPGVRYVLDDAHRLDSISDHQFDLVVSNFALMDIPDLAAVYASVYRVLRSGGRFISAITHPCFFMPTRTRETDERRTPRSNQVALYTEEGFWRPDGRLTGRVGAYHRTVSTYLNALIDNGFVIRRLLEPEQLVPVQGAERIPCALVISAAR